MMTDKQTQSFVEKAINKQFKIAGYNNLTYQDCFNIKDWYSKFTITKEQHARWKKWFIDNLSKYLSKQSSKKEFAWFDLMYGLRIEE